MKDRRSKIIIGIVAVILILLFPKLLGKVNASLLGSLGVTTYVNNIGYGNNGIYPGVPSCVIDDPNIWPVDDRTFTFFSGIAFNWKYAYAASYNIRIHTMYPADSERNCRK